LFENTDLFQEDNSDDDYHNKKETKLSEEVDLLGEEEKLTLKEYWHKKKVKRFFLYNTLEDTIEKFETKEDAEAKKQEILAQYQAQYEDAVKMYQLQLTTNPQAIQGLEAPVNDAPDIEVFDRQVDEMNYACSCCGYEMRQDTPSPFLPSYNGFPFFPFIAKYTPSAEEEVLRVKGIVRDLKDPNREINKSRSQFLHILNTSANSGWILDKGALNPEQKKQLEDAGSKPGIVLEKEPGSEVTRIEPAGASYAHINRGEKAEMDIKEISGINPDALAIQDKTTSGKAIALRIKQAVTILSKIFRNFRYTKEMLGGAVFNMIPNIFDANKLAKVLGPKFMEDNGIDKGYLNAFLSIIEDGRFDIVITESDNSATLRQESFEQLMSMAEMGIPIPPDLMIEFSNMPDSATVIKRIQEFQAQQQQAQAGPVK